jgi:hypothetical protein
MYFIAFVRMADVSGSFSAVVRLADIMAAV